MPCEKAKPCIIHILTYLKGLYQMNLLTQPFFIYPPLKKENNRPAWDGCSFTVRLNTAIISFCLVQASKCGLAGHKLLPVRNIG